MMTLPTSSSSMESDSPDPRDGQNESPADTAGSALSTVERLIMAAILIVASLLCIYAFTRIVPMIISHGDVTDMATAGARLH